MSRLLVLIMTAATGIAFLAGCSATAEAQDVDLPEKNIAEWVMPLDSYIDPARFETYAQNLLVQPCMESAGYAFDVPYRDPTSDNGPTLNAVDRRLFTTEIASRFGYHEAPANDRTAKAWEAFGVAVAAEAAANPAADSRILFCLDQANDRLDVADGSEQLAGQFEGDAYDAALGSETVTDRAREWRQCMSPLGIADLTLTPDLMPSPSQVSEFGLDHDVSESIEATAEEIRQARFDARCQASSGYLRALYDAEWERQVPLLRDNADELERVKVQNAAYEKRLARVIGDHAPTLE